jgi:hypothetical protein
MEVKLYGGLYSTWVLRFLSFKDRKETNPWNFSTMLMYWYFSRYSKCLGTKAYIM